MLAVVVVAAAALTLVLWRRARSHGMRGPRDTRRRRGAIATGLGRELFGRSLRIDAVVENSHQARTLARLADVAVLDGIDRLATELEAECERQREQLADVAPLTGRSREYALGLVDPRITALENAGRAVLTLAEAGSSGAGASDVSDTTAAISREANALGAALRELGSVEDVQRRIEALGEGQA